MRKVHRGFREGKRESLECPAARGERRRGCRFLAGAAVGAVVAVLACCAPTAPAGLNSPEPAKRRAAILAVMERGDSSRAPDLVRLLESDDAPTRMLAAAALERITGERFEYDFAATPAERRAGVERWRRHVEASRAGEGE